MRRDVLVGEVMENRMHIVVRIILNALELRYPCRDRSIVHRCITDKRGLVVALGMDASSAIASMTLSPCVSVELA